MAKRYAIWIARRECSDAVKMVEDIERLGWEFTGRRQQLLVDEDGEIDGFAGAKIPKKLPYIVFIIDELADLMMTNKEIMSSTEK